MENIIKEIIDIEKKYAIIIKESEDMKKNLPFIIEQKSKEKIRSIDMQTKEILIEIHKDAEKNKELKIKEIRDNLQNKIDFINNQYKNNKLKLEDNIYNNILKN